eukprot:9969410-Prorocentrum_lima.AAC.1
MVTCIAQPLPGWRIMPLHLGLADSAPVVLLLGSPLAWRQSPLRIRCPLCPLQLAAIPPHN